MFRTPGKCNKAAGPRSWSTVMDGACKLLAASAATNTRLCRTSILFLLFLFLFIIYTGRSTVW
jgi:hypothetical protein